MTRNGFLPALLMAALLGGASVPAASAQHASDVTERPYWQHRVSLFRVLPDIEDEVIFLGDSITEGCAWSELTGLPHVLNRGISGDTAWGLLARVDEVAARQPARVFVMIGTNDLSRGHAPDEVAAKVAEVLGVLRRQSPRTEIYLQSVLPIREREGWNHHNTTIRALNTHLAALARETGSRWVDVAPSFMDETGQLRADLSADGLHLNGAGYLLWLGVIRDMLGA